MRMRREGECVTYSVQYVEWLKTRAVTGAVWPARSMVFQQFGPKQARYNYFDEVYASSRLWSRIRCPMRDAPCATTIASLDILNLDYGFPRRTQAIKEQIPRLF